LGGSEAIFWRRQSADAGELLAGEHVDYPPATYAAVHRDQSRTIGDHFADHGGFPA